MVEKNKEILKKINAYFDNDIYATAEVISTLGINFPKIKHVIFNPPATIIIWDDGTKTVVKCGDNDIYDPEKGMATAICKKTFGNKGNYYNVFKKWLPKEEEKHQCSNCKHHNKDALEEPCNACGI